MKDNNLALVYDNFDLQLTSCEKVLEVDIDDNLTWTNHFQHVSKKISSYFWLLFQIKSYIPLHYRVLFYNAYNIKSQFKYCCFILLYTNLKNYREESVNFYLIRIIIQLLTYVEVDMQCYWTVNVILTDALC